MSNHERSGLSELAKKQRNPSPGCLLVALVIFPLALGTCGHCASVTGLSKTRAGEWPVLVLVAAGVVSGGIMLVGKWWRQRALFRRIAADLSEGVVEELHFKVRRAGVPKGLPGDVFLEAQGGGLIYLAGEYLGPHLAAKTFPCTEFSLVRGPRSRLWFQLRPGGAPLPSRRRPFATRRRPSTACPMRPSSPAASTAWRRT